MELSIPILLGVEFGICIEVSVENLFFNVRFLRFRQHVSIPNWSHRLILYHCVKLRQVMVFILPIARGCA